MLKRIEIEQQNVELNPEEEFQFTVKGFDQAGDPITVINPTWIPPKGGSITDQGVFTGHYTKREVIVTATCKNLEAETLESETIVTLRPVLRKLEIFPRLLYFIPGSQLVYLKPDKQEKFFVKGLDQFGKEKKLLLVKFLGKLLVG